MKGLFYVCSFVCAMLCCNASQAGYNTQGEGLLLNSHAKLTDSYTKYAAVNFISKKSISLTGASQGDDLDTAPIKETSCPEGETKVNGICIDVAACESSFPLTSVNKNVGNYVTKNCGKGNRFCYTSCQTGWSKNGCKCEAQSCAGFPHDESSGNNCNGVKSCKAGDTYKYKCTGCSTGYTLTEGGSCVSTACKEYGTGYLDSVTAHCKKNDTKRNGEQHCYKCTECEDGWVLGTDFTCSAKPCSDYGATYSSSQPSECVTFTTKKSGDNYCYSCTSCSDGYKVSNGTCVAKTCGTDPTSDMIGVTKESGIINCAEPIYLGKAGTKKCYRCQKCGDGYKLVASGLDCQAKTCGINDSPTGSTYDAQGTKTAIKNCIMLKETKVGEETCYKCSKCATGYNLQSNGQLCYEKTCGINGYDQNGNALAMAHYDVQGTTSSISNCKTYATVTPVGTNICRKCKTCAEGYKASGAGCVAKTCGTSDSADLKGTTSNTIANCHEYTTVGIAGDKVCMKCTTCAEGYTKNTNGTACTKKTCGIGDSYSIQGTSSKISNCKTYASVTAYGDGDICYKCSECALGYTLNTNKTACTAKTCGIGSDYTNQGTTGNIDNCAVMGATTVTGTSYCQTCAKCAAGYVLNSNKTSCSASNNGSCPQAFAEGMGKLANCKTMATAQVGEKICHTCTECNTDYEKDGSGGCKSSVPANCAALGPGWYTSTYMCKNYETKTTQIGDCHKCTECQSSWHLDTGKCGPTYCGQIGAPNSGSWHEDRDHCSSYSSQDIYQKTCYKCSACYSGYSLSNGACKKDKDENAYKCLQNGYAAMNDPLAHCRTDTGYVQECPYKSGMYKCNGCKAGCTSTTITKNNISIYLCFESGGYCGSGQIKFTGSCHNISEFENRLKDEITRYGY